MIKTLPKISCNTLVGEKTIMSRTIQVFAPVLAALLFSAVILAQEPVVNIDQKVHPHLAQAQYHIVEANKAIAEAQKANKYDMQGHAENARQLLLEADKELRAAADVANAANKKAAEEAKEKNEKH